MMRATIALALATLLGGPAVAQVGPVPKHGICPDGFSGSGDYCSPLHPGARAIVNRGGACPSGSFRSGSYCVLYRETPGIVERQPGQVCPSGTYGSGAGCVGFR